MTEENNVVMTVNVNETATGLVKFQVTGEKEYTLYVDVINGQAVLEDILDTGDYTVVATYMGDSRFNTNITSEDFTIVGHIKKDTPITASAVVNGNRVTLTVNVDENATGFVKVTVGSTVTNIEVVDGTATLTTVLVPNSYFVDVTYIGDDNYNMNKTSVTFTITDITKKNTNIDLNIDVYEDAALVKVDINESATGLVKFYMVGKETGEEYTMYMDVIDGHVETFTNNIEPGNYTVVATYMGDSVFNTNTTSKDVEILGHLMKDTPITADVVVNNNNVIITVTVNENATGFVKFTTSTTDIFAEVKDGKAIVSTVVPAGKYTIIAEYLGDEDFNANSTEVNFTVEEKQLKDTPIEVNVQVDENYITVTADVDTDATGLVRFEVTGAANYTLYADVENGTAMYEDTLPAGNYTIVATYLGDDKYNSNSTKGTFTIVGHVKKDTAISAVPSVDHETVSINIEVDKNATGYVTIGILGQTFVVPVNDGKAVFTYDFAPGIYSANIVYLGDDNFNNASTTTTFTVIEESSELKNTTIDVEVDTFENDVTITATVDSAASGLIEFNIDGDAIYLPVNNGVAVYDILLPAGDYNVEVTYLGSDKFNANRTSTSFTVVDHIKQNTTISSDVAVDDNNVMIIVTVNENATGFVKFTTSGTDIFAEVIDGKAIVTTVLPAGNYTVVATYLGDFDFNENETTISFSVAESEETVVNITVPKDLKEGDNATVKVEIPGATGNVTVIVDGKETVIELVNGSAEVPISNVSGGEHDVVVIYSGDDKHASAYQASTFNVAKKPEKRGTEILAKDFTQYACEYYEGERGRNFTFQLVDLNGTPLANKTIYIGYNGVILNRTTDANGYASVQINLKNACLYTFVLVFLDDDNYNASLAVQKITINKKTTSITASAKTFKATAKTKKYTVTLKTIKGASIDGKTYLKAGKKVTLLINGRLYTAKTNSKGKATFNIKLTKKGKFTAKISFAGDVTYKSTTKKVKITIK